QPAARYRCLVEVEGASPESDEARVALAQIPRHGWAANILRRQDARGFWVHRKTLYRPKYVATNWRLLALADLGLTVHHPRVRRGVQLMLEDYGGSDGPFTRRGGEPHFCFVGNTARMMILFGLGDDRRVRASLDWLADRQLDDGGWDCFGRPNGTLDCWEALAAYAAIGRRRWTGKWKRAVERGAEFYLGRRLLRGGRRRYPPWEKLQSPEADWNGQGDPASLRTCERCGHRRWRLSLSRCMVCGAVLCENCQMVAGYAQPDPAVSQRSSNPTLRYSTIPAYHTVCSW